MSPAVPTPRAVPPVWRCALEREPRRGVPEILSRLRRDADRRLEEPVAPRWARPVGWLIVAAIVAIVLIVVIRANPL